MTRVYVDIVGDLFHSGHVESLKKARALGDYLLVGVCADDVVGHNKRRPVLLMEERAASDRRFVVYFGKFSPERVS